VLLAVLQEETKSLSGRSSCTAPCISLAPKTHVVSATRSFIIFFRYSCVQFVVLLGDSCIFITTPHALVIAAYIFAVFCTYIFVASLSSPAFGTLSYFKSALVVLSQPSSWLVFLLGILTVRDCACTILLERIRLFACAIIRPHRSRPSFAPVFFFNLGFFTSPGQHLPLS
jgi:hypothetical protein